MEQSLFKLVRNRNSQVLPECYTAIRTQMMLLPIENFVVWAKRS